MRLLTFAERTCAGIASRYLAARQRSGIANGRDIGAIVLWLAALEHGGAGDQHVGTGGCYFTGIIGRDAAIDFDIDGAVARERAQPRNLLARKRNEFLAAKTRIDRH